jgi:PAS domain S-box-containing protein
MASKLKLGVNTSPPAEGEIRQPNAGLTDDAKTQEQLRTILESIGDGFLGIDADLRIVYVNAPAERMLGIRREDVLGQPGFDVFPHLLGTPLEQEYRLAAEGEIREFEHFSQPRNRCFHVRCFPRQGGGISIYFVDVTERKRAEEKLRLSEQRLKHAQEIAQVGSWEWDIETGAVWWSEQVYRQFGEDPATFSPTRQTFLQRLHPEDRAAWDEAIRRGVAGAAPYDLELRIVRSDGKMCVLHTRGEVLKGPDGRPRSMFGVCQDITEQKRVEEELTNVELQLSLAIRAGQAGTFDWNAQGNTTVWSDELLALYGMTREQFGGRHEDWLACLVPEDREAGETAVQHSLETGSFSLDFRIRRRDNGEVRWMHGRGQVFFDERGKPLHMLGVNVDTTEHKAADEALRESEERFRALADAMPVTVWSADEKGTVDYVNQHAYGYHGVSADDLEASQWEHLVHPDDLAATLRLWRQAIATGNPGVTEHRLRRFDGEYRWHQTKAVPVRDQAGQVTRWIGTSNDFHDHLMLEQELQRRVAERTAELEQIAVALRAAEAAARARAEELLAANKQLDEISYSLSHDLRTPMRSINGFCQVLLEDYQAKLDVEAIAYIKNMQDATRRMDELVNDLLNLSHCGRHEIRRTRVDLSALARTIAVELQRAEPERKVEFVVAPRLVVNADADLMHSLLQNLLDNAWKFSSKHPQARIEVGSVRQNGETVYFVRDDGAGFDAAYGKGLFKRLQRLHSSAEFAGTGIGLTIAHRIIQRHEGRIWAEGEVEKGATFFFTLPSDPRVTI